MSDGLPPQRIGDIERDRATEFLREHLAQGRLNQDEFDQRLEAALSAKIQPDLDRLFTDLPAPNPRHPGSALPQRNAADVARAQHEPGLSRRARNTFDTMAWALWPIAIVACFAIGWQYWWLIFVPMLFSGIWERKKQQDAAERKRYRKVLEQEQSKGPDHR